MGNMGPNGPMYGGPPVSSSSGGSGPMYGGPPVSMSGPNGPMMGPGPGGNGLPPTRVNNCGPPNSNINRPPMCPPTSCGPGGPGGPGMGPGPMNSPMTPSSTQPGMTISTGPGSSSPHGSSGSGTPIGGPGSAPPPGSNSPHGSTQGSVPPVSSGVPMGPMSAPPHGMPMGGGGMMSRGPPPGNPNPLSLSSEKLYPPGHNMVFNPQNPNAPPIYPCGNCRREVHDNDQAILCESGCNFWFHRVCTGLQEFAFHQLTQEVYAEWVCDTCFKTKDVPLVKFKP